MRSLTVLTGTLVLFGLMTSVTVAQDFALVTIDGFTIFDNDANDLAPADDGLVIFNNVTSGWTTPSGYEFQGLVELIPGVGAEVGLTGGDVVRMTSFTAEVPTGGTPGALVEVSFEYSYGVNPFGPANAVDQIVAFSDDSTSTPLAAGEDLLDRWQGFVATTAGLLPIPIMTGAPSVNLAGLNQPYDVISHNGLFIPAGDEIRGYRGELAFQLGGVNNQFVLPASAEVGAAFLTVPEPATTALAAMGMAGLMLARQRRRR